jgi:hypothetical protein
MLRTLLSLVVLTTALFYCYGQSGKAVKRGGITGFVGTEDGQPAAGAEVCVESKSGKSTWDNCLWSVGSDGHFTIDQWPIGSYQIFAIDEHSGYSTENQRPGQSVKITSNQPWQDITIQMRKPGAIVSGSITDSLTGKPVRPAWISYSGLDCNASGSTSRINESGAFDLTVPPSCDLVVMVTANGYRGWVFADPSNPSRPVLNLAAGQRRQLDIRLEPARTGSPSQ